MRRHDTLLRVATRVTAAALAALALAGAACASPSGGTAGRGPLLYVANGLDGTVTRLDGHTGRTVGPPIPAGQAPRWMAAGADGSLLVTAGGASQQGTLTHLSPVGGAWSSRSVTLEPGARVTHLAGDGGHTAAVSYVVIRNVPGAAGDPPRLEGLPCRLALIDLRRGEIERSHHLCAPGDTLTGLALEAGPGGPTAYAGIWSDAPDAPAGGSHARVLALDAARGAVTATHHLEGVPGQVVVGPAPGRTGRRLYSVSTAGFPEADYHDDLAKRFAWAGSWQITGLNPTTLEVESVHRLSHPPLWPALAPDGDHLYAFAGQASLTGGVTLLDVDLVAGHARILGRAPGTGISAFAILGERIYVPDAMGDAVWVLDRRRGDVAGRVATGRRPLGITAEAP